MNKQAMAREIGAAFPTGQRAVKQSPIPPDQIAKPVVKSGLAGSPRDCTIARAGVRTPDRAHYARDSYPGPTGGPVGYYGTQGPIGPWGSWK